MVSGSRGWKGEYGQIWKLQRPQCPIDTVEMAAQPGNSWAVRKDQKPQAHCMSGHQIQCCLDTEGSLTEVLKIVFCYHKIKDVVKTSKDHFDTCLSLCC
jgi:hypothetical protein